MESVIPGIKKIVIQGAGALGALYAAKIFDSSGFDVRLLASDARYERLIREGLVVNGRHYALPVIPSRRIRGARLI